MLRNKGAAHQKSEQTDMADRDVVLERNWQEAGKMGDDARSTLLAFL